MNTPRIQHSTVSDVPMEAWRKVLKVRAGRFKPIRGKSLLVCIGAQPSPRLRQFLAAFDVTNPRENVFFLNARHSGPFEIANGARLPYPLQAFGLAKRFLRKLRAGVVMVDEGAIPPSRFLDRVTDDDIDVVHVASLEMSSRGGSEIGGLGSQEALVAAQQLSILMAKEREPYIKLKKRVRFFLWRHVLYHFHRDKLRQLNSFEEIYESLGQPRSILCLGNGPSSEAPSIADDEYNSVFRVNHRWRERGFYTRADAVFTGAVESVIKVGTDSLYVFINPERAMRMVMRARQQVPRLSFCNARELGFPLNAFAPFQPTNGLIMVYLAVKLNPPVLTIAGIDLYRDPRGAYPDETSTPNYYTSAHDEKSEVGLLLELLSSFQGELRIIGDNLAAEYERYLSEERKIK